MSVVKRSIVISGHKTSMSMEDEFWEGFRAMAASRGLSLSKLAEEVDGKRTKDQNLSSAIRVAVLREAQRR